MNDAQKSDAPETVAAHGIADGAGIPSGFDENNSPRLMLIIAMGMGVAMLVGPSFLWTNVQHMANVIQTWFH
ncbi:hypothetical protein LLE49_26285 [Alicyclobacillus tolerans]|uniref:hypothetical protein n=1 Tax=Alicyclobacillus tolerans TaxID=90970 RepID=UPI001F39EB61|nr:hypothetical protein [Alicyclobacillus tolerans]MCF8568235.1 hypothetical protein [Alicyclobacillus tolerans]